MSGRRVSGWLPMLTALGIWFGHFMLCWAAVEIWPGQWRANLLAWGLTVLALLGLGLQWARLPPGPACGGFTGWNRRLGRGAVLIATVAVLFGALPSLVFLP